MKKTEVYLKPVPKDIIELARENEQLKTEIKNLLFLCKYEIQDRGTEQSKEWTYALTSCHRKHGFDYITNQIRELLKENKELKENQK